MQRKQTTLARNRLIVIVLLCVLVPPFGMLLVWRNRYNRRAKLALTLFSTMALTLIFTIILLLQPPEEIVPTPMSASYMNQIDEPQATSAPDTGYITPDFSNIQPSNPDDYVAPANPQG